jgi:hypothetical protein
MDFSKRPAIINQAGFAIRVKELRSWVDVIGLHAGADASASSQSDRRGVILDLLNSQHKYLNAIIKSFFVHLQNSTLELL